ISPQVGHDVFVDRGARGNSSRNANVPLPWSRAIGGNDGRPAVRGKKHTQKQGEQKRPSRFHNSGSSVVLATRRPWSIRLKMECQHFLKVFFLGGFHKKQ